MKEHERHSISGNTRNLLLVSFITLSLTALIFLISIQYENKLNKKIFGQIQSRVQTISGSAELRKMLIGLELDIRELITVVLKEPHQLQNKRSSLLRQFDLIIELAASSELNESRELLLERLRWYRTTFDVLLDDYAVINSALYEIYFYINSYDEQYQLMDRAAGQLLGDEVLKGKNINTLINHSHELLLQSHIMVNASITNSTPEILGIFSSSLDDEEPITVVDKIENMKSTLHAIIGTDVKIDSYAQVILENLPLFLENIHDLQISLYAMLEHYTDFSSERDASLELLDAINKKNKQDLIAINRAVKQHEKKSGIVALAITFLVIVVTCAGMILTRRMGAKLDLTARDAVTAREREKELNVQLEHEAVERREAAAQLKMAHDVLEQRVRERTEDLSLTNRSLALEVEERRNAEYALASEKERLTVTLRSIGEGVITIGMAGHIVLVNKVAESLTGWSQNEAFGKPLSQVFNIVKESTGQPYPDPVDQMMHSGGMLEHVRDALLVDKDGTRKNIEANGAPIRDKDSQVIGAVLVFRDVSEQVRMEKEALKAEKLKSVGVLAGGIAHDFNNILAAILGNITLAQLHMGSDEAKTGKLLQDAEKASLRAKNLTQQLLTFSKGGEPVKKIASIDDVIRESTDFILTGGSVSCEYTMPGDLWPVNIDSGQMSQVIQNIIINASHAMPEGGQIFVSCENFDNSDSDNLELPGGHFVRISIRDQGVGIPEDMLERIFDPYFTTKEEGSGLGLALTHSIVSKHEGRIFVDSGPEGTTFTMYLPASPEAEIVPDLEAYDSTKDTSSRRGTILIMDDEQMVREIARDMLVHLGFEVETAADGNEALQIYREKMASDDPIDVVIMDLTIPGGMGGKEAVQRLVEIDSSVKAIVSSGYSNDPVMSEYPKYGFSGVVNKPFQLNELLEAIARVL